MLRLPQSLYGRLTLGVALVTGILLTAEAWMVNWQVHRAVRELHGLLLEASSAPLVERLRQHGLRGGLPSTEAGGVERLGGSHHFVVLGADGRVLAGSQTLGALPGLPRLDMLRQPHATFRSSGQTERLWGLSRQVQTPDGVVVVQVAQDMRSIFALLDDVPAATLGPMLLAFAGGAVLLVLLFVSLTRLALQPLHLAAAEAAAIGPGRSARLNEAGLPPEVRPFIQAVNGALTRLEAALRQQRNFSQDVAHELRTPLALLMSEVDLLEDAEVAARLRRDITQLGGVVDELLGAAEAISTEPPPEAVVDLVALAHEVATALAPLAARADCQLAVQPSAPAVPANGLAEPLRRAVRNLVENAIRHAPAGSLVELQVGPGASLSVADRGPGVPVAQRERIFQRFWRRDRGGRSGAGLGLAIVGAIAAAHGGSVAVGAREGGGALFTLRLRPVMPPLGEG